MRLFFMRHGQAVERDEWIGEEAARPLSDIGERNTERAADRLRAVGLSVSAIYSSPLARAMRTAEIVGSRLEPSRRPVPDRRLAPGFGVEELDDILAELHEEQPGAESAMFVGHEPDLGLLVGGMVGCALIEFKKGALALVEIGDDDDEARLLWLVPQKLLI